MDAYKQLAQVLLDAPDGGVALRTDPLFTVRSGVLTRVKAPVQSTAAVTFSRVLTAYDDDMTLVVTDGFTLTIPTGLVLSKGITFVGASSTAVYGVSPTVGVILNGAALLVTSPTGIKTARLTKVAADTFLYSTG